jgi:hypothetical protein
LREQGRKKAASSVATTGRQKGFKLGLRKESMGETTEDYGDNLTFRNLRMTEQQNNDAV